LYYSLLVPFVCHEPDPRVAVCTQGEGRDSATKVYPDTVYITVLCSPVSYGWML